MDKQLKEIEKLEGYSGISGYAVYFKNKQQFEWLKQQVEEVSYLKRERNACEKLYDKEHEWAAYLARENQRYKEAVKKAIGACRYTNLEVYGILFEAMKDERNV